MTHFTLKADDLREALSIVEPFAHRDDTVPNVRVVRFIPTATGVTLAATNRFAIAEYTITYAEPGEPGEPFSLPLPAAQDWLKRVKPRQRVNWMATVTVDAGKAKATLALVDEVSTFATQDGEWIPSYERLFPADAGQHPHGVIGMSVPNTLGLFARAFARQNAGLRFAFGEKPTSGITVTCDGVPAFRGLLMPVNLREEEG